MIFYEIVKIGILQIDILRFVVKLGKINRCTIEKNGLVVPHHTVDLLSYSRLDVDLTSSDEEEEYDETRTTTPDPPSPIPLRARVSATTISLHEFLDAKLRTLDLGWGCTGGDEDTAVWTRRPGTTAGPGGMREQDGGQHGHDLGAGVHISSAQVRILGLVPGFTALMVCGLVVDHELPQ
jgi:hypothetical protein